MMAADGRPTLQEPLFMDLKAKYRPVGPAEVLLPCADLAPTLEFFVGGLGFRVETIFPAEEPRVASLSGYGLRVRLEPVAGDPGVLRLACAHPGSPQDPIVVAPNGTRIDFFSPDAKIETPPLLAEFVVSRHDDGPKAGEGRAGMVYRDLIPGRQGGRFIASHIALPEGGPVADWVHYHKVRFQLIFCRRGWARLVYEDQGAPFIMSAGDCVLQPPLIRHRVLESSPGFEVVEIGCPALHETLADHDMALPNGGVNPQRNFSGQTFIHHVAAAAPWTPFGETGFEQQKTGLRAATGGLVDVYVLRPAHSASLKLNAHRDELLFGFLLEGSAVLEQGLPYALEAADAFVVPAETPWALSGASKDLRLLQIIASA